MLDDNSKNISNVFLGNFNMFPSFFPKCYANCAKYPLMILREILINHQSKNPVKYLDSSNPEGYLSNVFLDIVEELIAKCNDYE